MPRCASNFLSNRVTGILGESPADRRGRSIGPVLSSPEGMEDSLFRPSRLAASCGLGCNWHRRRRNRTDDPSRYEVHSPRSPSSLCFFGRPNRSGQRSTEHYHHPGGRSGLRRSRLLRSSHDPHAESRPNGGRGNAFHGFLLSGGSPAPRAAPPSSPGRYAIRSGMCDDQYRVLRRLSAGGLPGQRNHHRASPQAPRLCHSGHRQVASRRLDERSRSSSPAARF